MRATTCRRSRRACSSSPTSWWSTRPTSIRRRRRGPSASSNRRCSSPHSREGETGAARGCSRRSAIDPAQVRAVCDAAAAWAAERRASGAIARRRADASRAPGCRSGSTPASPSDSAPTPRCEALWPATLAAVDAGRLPVSVAARTLLRRLRRPSRTPTIATTDERRTSHARHHRTARRQARQRPPRRRREAHRRPARQGQAHRARADRAAARRGHVRGMGHVRRAPQPRLRHGDRTRRRAMASSPATG